MEEKNENKNKDLKEKKKRQKDIKIGILIIIIHLIINISIMSMFSYFGNKNKKIKKEDELYGIYNYLEEKYNEKFVYYEPYRADLSIYGVLMTSERFPDKPFVVTVENRWNKEERTYYDNYKEIKDFDKIYNFLKNRANDSFKDVNLFYRHRFINSSENIPSNIPFEMFLRCESFLINYWIEIKSSDDISKDHIEKFVKTLENLNSNFYLVIVIVDDKNYSTQDFNFLKQTITDKKYINYVEVIKLENEEIIFFWNEEK